MSLHRTVTAFYYGASDCDQKHVDHDIVDKILQCPDIRPDMRYAVMLSHHNNITTFNVEHNVITRRCNVQLPRGTGGVASHKLSFQWFVENVIALDADTEELHSLFLSGHSSGFHMYFDVDDSIGVSFEDLADVIYTAQLRPHAIYLDACLGANLEALVAFSDVTPIIVAFETFCPWEGLISFDVMHRPDPVEQAKKCLTRFESRELLPDEQPCDVSVLSTAHAKELHQLLREVMCVSEEDFDDVTANPSYPYHEDDIKDGTPPLYDVKAICLQRGCEASRRVIDELLPKTVLFYAKSKDNPQNTHGISLFQKGKPLVA
eukprot:PhM_4_TR14077/c2_g2_i1/m.60747